MLDTTFFFSPLVSYSVEQYCILPASVMEMIRYCYTVSLTDLVNYDFDKIPAKDFVIHSRLFSTTACIVFVFQLEHLSSHVIDGIAASTWFEDNKCCSG